MSISNKTRLNALLVAVAALAVAALASPAIADDSQAAAAKTEQARCAANSANCRKGEGSNTELSRAFLKQARLEACQTDSPECTIKHKTQRTLSDHELRDRHACRD